MSNVSQSKPQRQTSPKSIDLALCNNVSNVIAPFRALIYTQTISFIPSHARTYTIGIKVYCSKLRYKIGFRHTHKSTNTPSEEFGYTIKAPGWNVSLCVCVVLLILSTHQRGVHPLWPSFSSPIFLSKYCSSSRARAQCSPGSPPDEPTRGSLCWCCWCCCRRVFSSCSLPLVTAVSWCDIGQFNAFLKNVRVFSMVL